MRIAFMTALALFAGAPVAGQAATPKLTTANFARASECVALAQAPSLQQEAPDVSALEAEIDRQKHRVHELAAAKAREAVKAVRIKAKRADTPEEVEGLKADLRRACAGLV